MFSPFDISRHNAHDSVIIHKYISTNCTIYLLQNIYDQLYCKHIYYQAFLYYCA